MENINHHSLYDPKMKILIYSFSDLPKNWIGWE